MTRTDSSITPSGHFLCSYEDSGRTVHTVGHVNVNGEEHDLNATGESCADTDALRAFVRECFEAGAFDEENAGYLMSQIVDIDERAV